MKILGTAAVSLIAGLVAVAAAAGVTAAQEKGTKLVLSFPKEASVGDRVPLTALLQDEDGKPVPGAELSFVAEATFFNATNEVRLGRARTDQAGQATFTYAPRREGNTGVVVRFGGMTGYAETEASAPLDIHGGPQQYSEATPFRIPGANVWTAAGILAVVWGLYLFALALLVNISREGADSAAGRG